MSRSRTIAPPVGFDVAGREDIARILGVTVDRLDRLMQSSDGPPVFRYVGRPIARRRELDAWLKKQPRST